MHRKEAVLFRGRRGDNLESRGVPWRHGGKEVRRYFSSIVRPEGIATTPTQPTPASQMTLLTLEPTYNMSAEGV